MKKASKAKRKKTSQLNKRGKKTKAEMKLTRRKLDDARNRHVNEAKRLREEVDLISAEPPRRKGV
jgi:hypothetical protein